MEQQENIDSLKQEIIKVDLNIKQLIKTIYEAQSLERMNELNTHTNNEIKKHKFLIHKLDLLYIETRKAVMRESLQSDLEGFRHQFECNCGSLRKANAFARKTINERTKADLFETISEKEDETDSILRKRKGNDRAFLVNKSTAITSNLYQITKLMSEQVDQSNAALHALVNSSGTVIETQEEFKSMGGHLGNSRTLLTKYGRREVTDKIVILLAMTFFFACVLYVIIKRIF